jgi:hypothetical protein
VGTLDYNSGAVEGNLIRIKAIKRQVYGRGGFDLLRKRILHRTWPIHLRTPTPTTWNLGATRRRRAWTPRPGFGDADAMSKRRARRLMTCGEPPHNHLPHRRSSPTYPALPAGCWPRLAPLLAEDGYHVDHDGVLDGPDLDDPTVFHAALRRAIERHNLQQSTTVGATRENTCTTLQLAVQAIAATADGATVAACIGAGMGLLDNWLTAHHPDAASAAKTETSFAGFALPGRAHTYAVAVRECARQDRVR